jgi:cell division protein FtsW (lipid II flippase)
MAFLVAAFVVVGVGMWMVYQAKVISVADAGATVNLNQITGPQQVLPLLGAAIVETDQNFVATRIHDARRRGVVFRNVGALTALRVSGADVSRNRGLTGIAERWNEARKRTADPHASVPLLTGGELARLKPLLRVRDLEQFRWKFWLWSGLLWVSFFAVYAGWRLRGFAGDPMFLPCTALLCGLGFILMASLRDPLRDTLMFADFAQGVAVGCVALFVFSFPDYERHFSRLSYVPLLAAFLLALALGLFGSGPGTSDAKVNLFFFQPVEVIRLLLVFFLAGYFAQNWDALRQLRQKHGKLAERFNLPRLDYVLPLVAAVLLSLGLFLWLNDLGPALLIGSLFLAMYAVARNRVFLAVAGFGVIVAGFALAFLVGYPHTVTERVEMWLSPWDNHVRGGEQVAHSLWTLSTGGVTGTGLGLGDSETMPAAHTDLIISALGEQTGLAGVLAVFAVYSFLIWRSIAIAQRARGTYSFFLVLGLALVLALQIILITGGLLGLLPLSGVVSPFLSFGRTSMLVNFVIVAIILSVSARAGSGTAETHFTGGVRVCTALLGAALAVIVGRFAWIQTVRADATLARASLVQQADGVRRYHYNPRLLEAAKEVPKGSIFDRNGVPLATSDIAVIEKHRGAYEKLGVDVTQTVQNQDPRHYPLGTPLFYLLGVSRSRLKQGARNTAFQERASRIRLQGYDDVAEVEEEHDDETGRNTSRIRRDYRALIPLVRHRYEPQHPAVREILDRPRDVRMSIDAGLQMRATSILSAHLSKLGKSNGAVVVMDPATGDLLAAVSLPLPTQEQFAALKRTPEAPLPNEDLLDRARFGLYPPGSTFKLVTAIAALRKNPALSKQQYDCVRLPDGRVGNVVWKRPVRDDVKDTQPHGTVNLMKGTIVSCNAFFAQLGTNSVGAEALYETATRLGISVARPNRAEELGRYLPQSSYGQGEVVASPFQMARVAAVVANGGSVVQGRWLVDETNLRMRTPQPLLEGPLAQQIAAAMRGAVTSGTGRVLSASTVPVAGKTGTAEIANGPSHAWFAGFAPYGSDAARRIAFAVLVENGQYGGSAAAPIAGDIVSAARQLGLI